MVSGVRGDYLPDISIKIEMEVDMNPEVITFKKIIHTLFTLANNILIIGRIKVTQRHYLKFEGRILKESRRLDSLYE